MKGICSIFKITTITPHYCNPAYKTCHLKDLRYMQYIQDYYNYSTLLQSCIQNMSFKRVRQSTQILAAKLQKLPCLFFTARNRRKRPHLKLQHQNQRFCLKQQQYCENKLNLQVALHQKCHGLHQRSS